jgi:outer membrane lipoprotein
MPRATRNDEREPAQRGTTAFKLGHIAVRHAVPVLCWLVALTGCASSQIPQPIRAQPAIVATVSEVQQRPEQFLGKRLRWGGTIIAVNNLERRTEIEILSRPLGAEGRPRSTEPGEGRFIALLQGFADPAEYPENRSLTVSGRIERIETRPVGEYPYPYPVIRVENRYLWPQPPTRQRHYYPGPWYDPWYQPWYPWRPWYW